MFIVQYKWFYNKIIVAVKSYICETWLDFEVYIDDSAMYSI